MGASAPNGASRRALSEINVTPFVDVMLVLLIIFMVTAPMMQQGVDVDLPETTTQPLRVKDEPLILTVKKDGKYYLGQREIPAAELRDKAVRVDTRVRWGYAADEIVTAAREAGADLIAMSTHGRSGLGRVIFGSVAQAVLRQAEAPVFLMRATEAQVASRASRVAAPGAVSAPRRTR